MLTRQEIEAADRDELIEHLEGRGFACYAHETTGELRDAALEDLPVYREDCGLEPEE